MPNLSMSGDRIVKGELQEGEIVKFANAGDYVEIDFSQAQDGSKVQRVFQILLEKADGSIKTLNLNKSSQKSLKPVYGANTDDWVGKQARVTYVKMSSFGKIQDVMVLEAVQ